MRIYLYAKYDVYNHYRLQPLYIIKKERSENWGASRTINALSIGKRSQFRYRTVTFALRPAAILIAKSKGEKNMRKKFFALFFAGMLLSGNASASEIVIDGSTTILPFAQIAVERFVAAHPDTKISISGGGSGNGIKALIDKTADIANASREIKKSELEKARANGVEPFETIVALDCIVAIVHPENPVSALSMEQLRKIYTGEIINWKDVGGSESPIAVVGRDSSSGTYGTWQEMIVEKGDSGKKSRVVPRAQVAASSGAMLAVVAENKFAIGYDGIGYLNDSVKALDIGGIKASVATAKDKSYPLSRFLYMYTDKAPSGEVKSFVDYMLSPDGQKIVADTGFIPLD